MSLSRKNWSALSSLTRQWTVEDEEEVERERRRKIRTDSTDPGDSPTEQTPPMFSSAEDAPESVVPEAPVDFVEMLRVRDERRWRRHTEMLRRQREEEEKEEGQGAGPEATVGGARVEVGQSQEAPATPASFSDITETGSVVRPVAVRGAVTRGPKTQGENENSGSVQDTNEEAPTKPSRLFVSSLSISMDKGPTSPPFNTRVVSPLSPTPPAKFSRVVSPISPTFSTGRSRVVSPISPTFSTGRSRVVSPISPTFPTGRSRVVSSRSSTGSFRSISPEDRVGSPAPDVTRPITQNGGAQASQNGTMAAETVPSAGQTEGAPFQRQSPRALSFKMVRKREPSVPFQRSASVRMASKTTQASKAPEQEEDKQSPFQRNTRQRVSSRAIQEKMERLALAAQKSESVRSPSVSQSSMYVLVDEVTRKRGLFEKDPAAGDNTPGASRQDFRNFSAGISQRINRWVSRAQSPASIFTPPDLRNVDITSKRDIWENRAEEATPK